MTQKKKRLVKFVGKCMYAQVYPGQERAPHPDAVKKDPHTANDRHYAITVECSEELYKKLIAAGVSRMVLLKEVEDSKYITIKGSKNRTDKATGEVYNFSDPIIVDVDEQPMDISTLIGNGSQVEVIAELADVNHFKALRLQKVKVLNLVEYHKNVVEGEIELEEIVNKVDNNSTKVDKNESFF